jgi:acylphosphatase
VNSVGAQLTIRGFVQGIGYRYYCYRAARSLGLTGWVKNNPNGSVLVMAEGDRSLVEELIKELKIGPPSASVTDVDVAWTEHTGRFRNFDISI